MFNEIKAAWNPEIFTKTFSAWINGLSINSVIMMIMMIFMLVGAIDKIRGNKLGYGEEFDNGFNAMGPLAAAMAGVVAAAPVLALLLKPFIVPIYKLVGADPSMFATTLLACDMGGYPLAMYLANNLELGFFSGLILGTMMGPTIVFTIPVALSIIKAEDRPYLGAGVLAGLITIPLGCIAGGLAMNMTKFAIPFKVILVNIIPVIAIAAIVCAGLWIFPDKMIAGFAKFGNFVTALITAFTAIAVFEYITGIKFPIFNIMVEADEDGVIPLESGLLVCGQIAIVLIGAFPMVKWITKTFGGVLQKIGNALGMNAAASAGMVANLANNIAMFNIMGDMDPKGKLLNVAFAVSAAFVFGDHLGFVAGAQPEMIFPVIIGKLVAGVTAVIVANMLAPVLLSKIKAIKKD
ncbi:MAG: ethanolamine utilization protein EutH [Synergistaceae bacterium]|nr:ethanolamine utilization protein EutH [Synergistaceae bacterium]